MENITHSDELDVISTVNDTPRASADPRLDGRDISRKIVSGDRLLNISGTLLGSIASVSITVTAGTATTTSAANSALVGGSIIGYFPTATLTPDKFVESIVLNANGSITITLSGNTTNTVSFSVTVGKTS